MSFMDTFKTGMVAQEINFRTIANNMANGLTVGYKAQRADFQDTMYQTITAAGASTTGSAVRPTPVQIGLGTQFASHTTDFSQGTPQATGNPTDMAIIGEGFFVVQKDGTNHYTRDGTFKIDANGVLVTSDGYSLVPNITIPAGSRGLSVSPNGSVSAIQPGQTNPQEIGKIQVAIFTNVGGLERKGKNLFAATDASGQPQLVNPGENGGGTILGGHIESSNTNIVEEMVKMIFAQRYFEANSKGIQVGDEVLGIVNNVKR
jgi:flagellar basal-body rod protein FlgG